MKGIAVILALAVVAIATVAQTPARQKQQFEVASVKLNKSRPDRCRNSVLRRRECCIAEVDAALFTGIWIECQQVLHFPAVAVEF